MTDTALFTQADLADALQISTGDIDVNVFNRVLKSATGKVQGIITHPVFVVAGDVAVIEPAGRRVVQLPHWPVSAVASVVVNAETDITLDPSCYTFLRTGHLMRKTQHRAFPAHWRFGWGWAPITVTYTHGYDTVPEPIKTVALELAIGDYTNPLGLRSETIANYSYSLSTASGKGIADYHQQILAQYQ